MAEAERNDGAALVGEDTLHLPCQLTDEEVLRAGDELAQTIEDMATEEARAQDVRAQLKARVTELESRRSALASKVRRREEYRDIKVAFWLRDDSMVDIVREDTGEVVRTRTPHESELQHGMDFEQDETGEQEESVSA